MAVIFRGPSEALSFRAALFAAVNVSSSKRKVRRLRYHQLPTGLSRVKRFARLASCSPKLEPFIGFPQIIWLAMKSSKPRGWTELEVKTLISMSGQRHSADEISKCLGRYVGSVKTKARELGLVAVKKRSKAAGGARTDDY